MIKPDEQTLKTLPTTPFLLLAVLVFLCGLLPTPCLAAPLTCDPQGFASVIGTEVAATACVPGGVTDDTPVTYQYRDFECVGGKVTLKSVGNKVVVTPNQVMSQHQGIQYRTFRNKQGSYFFIVMDDYKGTIDGKPMTSYPAGGVYPDIFTLNLDPQPATPNCLGGDHNNPSMERCALSSINSGTGRLSHSQELFSVKNAQPLSLSASLNYRSLGYQQSAIGSGWSLNYESYLQDNGASGVTVWEEGQRRIYTLYGGSYDPPRGDHSTFIKNPDGSYLLTEKDGLRKTFNPTGAITTIQDRNDNTLSFSYTAGKLTSVSDPNGRSMTLAYDVDNKLGSITDPRGKVHTLSYTGGRLSAVTLPDGTHWDYSYNADGLLATKATPGGETVTYTYTPDQRVQTARDPKGLSFGAAYTSVVAEDGFVPDSYTPVPSVYVPFNYTEKNGSTWTYKYDPLLEVVTSITDPLGNTTSYNYDRQLNLLSRTEPGNNGTTNTTGYSHDAQGNVLTVTDPLGQVTTLTYNSLGQVLTVSGAPGSYGFTYDTKGNLLTSSDPLSNSTSYGYDAKGNLTTVTNAKTQTTTLGYDANNNLTSITQPGNVITQFSYDNNGNLLTMTDAANKLYQFSYDDMNRLTSITDPLLNTTTYSYDSNGNPKTVTDANGKVTTYSFNYTGQLEQIKDALDNITTLNYGSGGCPSCSGADKLTALIDARNHSTTYSYDILGRTLSETDPLGKATGYGYDKLRTPVSRTDARNSTVTYTYDALTRLTRKSYPDSTSQTYSYDSRNNILTATNKDISYTFIYDTAGRMTSTSDSRGYALDYEYDSLGMRTKTTLQKGTPDEHVTSYSYDSKNRPETITSRAGSFTYGYDTLNRRQSTAYPNGITTSYSYDSASRLKGISHNNSATPIAFANYSGIDKVGNRTGKTTPAGTETYSYDNIYRLTKAETPKGTENYSYDAVGNRLTGPGPKDSKYQYDAANRMLMGKIFGHDFDNNGNQTSRTTSNTQKAWTYSWDFENRLIQSEQTKGAEKRTVTFQYDPFGRRIQKQLTTTIKGVNNTATWQYVYDGDNIALEVYTNEAGAVEKTWYTHGTGTDEHLALERNSTNYFYHADGLGSVTAITDQSKNLVQTYEYDSFGNTKPSANLRNSYAYTGRELDRETGLYYYRARYYDPMDGRFISKDPISFAGGDVNLYNYVGGNAVNFTDPLGLFKLFGKEININAGGGLQGGFQALLVGLNGSVGGIVGTDGQRCGVITICGRLGPGLFAGGGAFGTVGGTLYNTSNVEGWSVGGGGDAGWGASTGGQAAIGFTNIGGSIPIPKIKAGGGFGANAGLDVCYTFTFRCSKPNACSSK